jgi:hypothetical protein
MSDDVEQQLRIRLMEAGIELKQAQTNKSKQDWRLDPTRVIIQSAIASAAVVGAVAGVLGFFIGRGH